MQFYCFRVSAPTGGFLSFYDVSFHCYGDRGKHTLLSSLPSWILNLLVFSPVFCPPQLQTSQSTVSDVSQSLDQADAGLTEEQQQRKQIQKQLKHTGEEVKCLQWELSLMHRTTEKRVITSFLESHIEL